MQRMCQVQFLVFRSSILVFSCASCAVLLARHTAGLAQTNGPINTQASRARTHGDLSMRKNVGTI